MATSILPYCASAQNTFYSTNSLLMSLLKATAFARLPFPHNRRPSIVHKMLWICGTVVGGILWGRANVKSG